MRTRIVIAAATIAVAGVLAGCDRTTPGTVAMTTEAGQPSNAPPPGDALDLTCQEYARLDRASQTAAIEEILNEEASLFGPNDAEIAKSLADAVCTLLPTSKMSEILLGETPP